MTLDRYLSIAALILSGLAIGAAIYAAALNARLTRRLNAPVLQLSKFDPPFVMGGSTGNSPNALGTPEERKNLYLIFSGLVPTAPEVASTMVQPSVNTATIRLTNSGKTGATTSLVTFKTRRAIKSITVKFPFDEMAKSHVSTNARSGEVRVASLPVGQSLDFDVLLEPLRVGGTVNLEQIARGGYSWETFSDPNHPTNPQLNSSPEAWNVRGTASLDMIEVLASCDNCEESGRLDELPLSPRPTALPNH